jgi:hypothetical protein
MTEHAKDYLKMTENLSRKVASTRKSLRDYLRMTEHARDYLKMTENLSRKVASTRKSLRDYFRMTEHVKDYLKMIEISLERWPAQGRVCGIT